MEKVPADIPPASAGLPKAFDKTPPSSSAETSVNRVLNKLELGKEKLEERPWTDKAHLLLQNVDELGDLIQPRQP